MSLKSATVVRVLDTQGDLQKISVRLGDATIEDEPHEAAEVPGAEQVVSAASTTAPGTNDPGDILAYNYLALGKEVQVGERVLVNTVGIDLALGTGNAVFVVPSTPHASTNSYGHIVKLRYTPLQTAVDSVEEQESPHHATMQAAKSIGGMPVVCCELHSQMPLVAAAIKHEAPDVQVAYIMNDAAALPLAYSELARQSKEAGLIDCAITSGNAFGGDLETINVYSALLAARNVCLAGVAIVAPGPGIAGSGTVFGHDGIAQGEALNAVAALEGQPIAALRLSWQDLRPRHAGISHHTETVLGQVCHVPVVAPIPDGLFIDLLGSVEQRLEALGLNERHEFPLVSYDYQAIDLCGVKVSTMGRDQEDDPEFFSAAFAAGVLAARAVSGAGEPDQST